VFILRDGRTRVRSKVSRTGQSFELACERWPRSAPTARRATNAGTWWARSPYIGIYVDTPLEVCEQRDPKGMYSLARSGKIKEFTGVDDPYESSPSPEIVLDTVSLSAHENAQRIMSYLTERGRLR